MWIDRPMHSWTPREISTPLDSNTSELQGPILVVAEMPMGRTPPVVVEEVEVS